MAAASPCPPTRPPCVRCGPPVADRVGARRPAGIARGEIDDGALEVHIGARRPTGVARGGSG